MGTADTLTRKLHAANAVVVLEHDAIEPAELKRCVDGAGAALEIRDVGISEIKSPTDGPGKLVRSMADATTLVAFARRSQYQVDFNQDLGLPGEQERALAYAGRRGKAWFETLTRITTIRFAGILFELNLPASGEDATIIQSAETMVDMLRAIHPSGSFVEFISRLAVKVDDMYYDNLQVDVYETRQADVAAPQFASGAPVEIPRVPLHQMTIASRGLRFVVDINTKPLALRQEAKIEPNHWARCMELASASATIAIPALLDLIKKGRDK